MVNCLGIRISCLINFNNVYLQLVEYRITLGMVEVYLMMDKEDEDKEEE